MKRRILVLAILPVLVFALAGVVQASQGRMGGMADPYGLVQDESDFLIHPAKIANGEGQRFYGYYRFTHTNVMDWDYDVDINVPGIPIPLPFFFSYDTSGDEETHNAHAGTAAPLGPGRLGLFFFYEGSHGDYDGDVYSQFLFPPATDVYVLTSDLDAFTLRLLYGLPVGGLNLGGEFQFSYRQEENKTEMLQQFPVPIHYQNQDGSFSNIFSGNENFSAYMMPYDSNYMEAILKGSLDAALGPVEVAFTVRGGFIFNGNNNLERVILFGPYDLDGDVEGWRAGGDLWLRYALTNNLAIPFLVRIDYQEKTRDGDGLLAGFIPLDYDNTQKNFEIEAGGGLDTELATGKRIAAGIYYNYYDDKDDFFLTIPGTPLFSDYSNYPALIEHRVRLTLVGEWDISPAVTLRMGMEPFYGWIKEDFDSMDNTLILFNWTENVSLDGSHWGISASVGGSVTFQHLTLEPFVGFGYQEIKLDGDGTSLTGIIGELTMDVDKLKREWCIGGGLSILFDL